jgi:negative regulator of sigma E activity
MMNVERDPVSEKLSALLDDELSVSDARTLLSKMANDSSASHKWRRYNLAREAMQQKTVLLTDANFADRVSKLIQDEPIAFSPRAKSEVRLEKIFTYAIAASLALAAVLVARSFVVNPESGAAMIAMNAKSASSVMTASVKDRDLDEYLTLHDETTYLSGSQGMLPTIRLVSGSNSR